MKIALYNENLGEMEILLGQLDQCTREYLRFVEITPYVRQEDFYSLVRDGPEVDLFIVAQDGTFSLEIVELLWEKRPHAHIFLVFGFGFCPACLSVQCGLVWEKACGYS